MCQKLLQKYKKICTYAKKTVTLHAFLCAALFDKVCAREKKIKLMFHFLTEGEIFNKNNLWYCFLASDL